MKAPHEVLPHLFNDMSYILTKDKEGVFRKHVDIINETEYEVKGSLELFPKASTTWGRRFVMLTPEYFKWYPAARSAHLIHEATHSMQHDRMTSPGFFTAYLLGFGWYWMEKEAEKWQNKFLILCGYKKG